MSVLEKFIFKELSSLRVIRESLQVNVKTLGLFFCKICDVSLAHHLESLDLSLTV